MKNKCNTLLATVLAILTLTQCGEGYVDRTAYEQERKGRELIRLTAAEINTGAYTMGDSVYKQIQQVINTQAGASPKAHTSQLDSIAKAFNVTIKRITGTPEQSSQPLNKIEKQLFEAYSYSQANKETLSRNVQRAGDTAFLYTMPLTIKQPATTASKADSLAGMWAISFPKSQVVFFIKAQRATQGQ